MELIHECVTNKVVLIRPNDKSWYNSSIRSYARKRDPLKRKAVRTVRTAQTEDWRKCKNMRNKDKNLKKKYPKERFSNNVENTLFESSDLNPKAYWQLLRDFINTFKNSEVIPR